MAKTKTLTEGTPWKLLLSFSIPILIGQVVQLFYSLVDTIAVGQSEGPNGAAAMAVIGPVWSMMISFGLLLGIPALIHAFQTAYA